MNTKLFFALIASGLFLGASGAAMASGSRGGSPTEADAYCERVRNGSPQDSPGIGWYDPVIRPPLDPDGDGAEWLPLSAAPLPVQPQVMVCEGEHWDGQDPLRPNSYNSGTCTGNILDTAADTYVLAVNQCSTPSAMPVLSPTNPVGLRLVAQGDGSENGNGHGAVYAAVRIINVGSVGLFAGGCQHLTGGSSDPFGSAGTQTCQGRAIGHGVLGIYLQDDEATPLDNTLARIVTIARLTKGYVAEGDCTQSEYAGSAWASHLGNEPTCGRDNTAISIELLA